MSMLQLLKGSVWVVFAIFFLPVMVQQGKTATDDFPKKAITMVVHASPGSPVDLMARKASELAGKILGVPMVVETRTGGSGAVAMAHVLSQPADGYLTYALTRSNADLFASGNIKGFSWKDFTYLIRLQTDPFVLAGSPSAPFKTIKEMITYAKKNPSKIRVGGFGTASAHHIAALKFARAAGIQFTWVPYDGSPQAVSDILGGHLEVVHTNPSTVIKHVQAGRLIALATSAGQRLASFPDAPAYKELGVNVEDYHWRGIAVKKGVPEERIKILESGFKRAMETPEFKDYTAKANLFPGYLGSADFTKLFGETVEETIATIKELGIR
jgi:tripartite-type tricarboxylate transporter receptor subunit TctC